MRAWGGGGSDRKTLVLELWEAQNLNSHISFCHSHAGRGGGAVTERPWFWSFGRPKSSILGLFVTPMRAWGGRAVTERPWFGRPKSSILRSFCHSHAGLGEGPGSDRKTLVLELWEAQNLNSRSFCHSQGGRAVTERPWFWSFGRPKTSIVGLFVTPMQAWGGGGGGGQ